MATNLKGDKVKKKLPDFEDREAIAIATLLIMGAGVQIFVGLVGAATTLWIWTFGVANGTWIHHHIWGWLTEWHPYQVVDQKKHGHVVKSHTGYSAHPNKIPLIYLMVWVQLYLLYQLAELINWVLRGYANLANARIH